MQQEILLIGVKLNELLVKIGEVVENKLSKSHPPPNKEDSGNKYLSRAEVAKLLKISLPTLHIWTKLKLLQSYKIGNRVLYKQQEIDGALLNSVQLKYKRTTL